MIEPLVGTRGVKFDAMSLNFVGSLNTESKLCFAWHTTPVNSFEEMVSKGMITAGSGSTSSIFQYPTVIKNLLGAKLKVIGGYKGSAASLLALERGEVTGMCGLGWSSLNTQRPQWLKEKKIKLLAQIGYGVEKKLIGKNVPEIWKFVKDANKQAAMKLIFYPPGRPYILPQGTPKDRVKAMQDAFMATTKDPAFIADAKKIRLAIAPTSGPDMRALYKKLYASSPEVVELAKAALSKKGTVKCKKFTDAKYCRASKKKKKKKGS